MSASASVALIPLFDWRIAFRLGLLALLLLPFPHALLPESVRFPVEKGRRQAAVREVGRVERIARLRPLRWSLADLTAVTPPVQGGLAEPFPGNLASMTILVWSTYPLNTMTLYGLSAWLPSLLVKEGFSLVKSYGYAMVQAGGSAVGGFLLGCLLDRFGRKPGLVLTYFLEGFSVILFGLARTDPHLFLSAAAAGIFVVGTPTAGAECGVQ
jgi:MFS family permease